MEHDRSFKKNITDREKASVEEELIQKDKSLISDDSIDEIAKAKYRNGGKHKHNDLQDEFYQIKPEYHFIKQNKGSHNKEIEDDARKVEGNGHETEKPPVVEVVFKGNRRERFQNDKHIQFKGSDLVIVETGSGLDAGHISNCYVNTLEKLRKQLEKEKKKKPRPEKVLPKLKIIRKAKSEDIERYDRNAEEDMEVVKATRKLVDKHHLEMKVTEAEWQFDRQRLTIYFTAPQRVDFRELVKDLARTFKTRIELRQISTREETKRLGCGMGGCGQPLCCASFLNEFSHVTLDHARMQQLSNNIAKLSGNCGRLKCCLLFEYESYRKAFEKYPPLDSIVITKEGPACIGKVDIFNDVIQLQFKKSGKYQSITFEELNELRKNGKIRQPVNGEGKKCKNLHEQDNGH